MKLCVVVPMFNELSITERSLQALRTSISLSKFKYILEVKVVVSDGGSQDGSAKIAKIFCQNSNWLWTQVQIAPSVGRTILNGVRTCNADVYFIIPIDCEVGPLNFQALDQALGKGIACGGFYKEYIPNRRILEIYASLQNKIRLGLLKHTVWTNGIFLKREILDSVPIPSSGFLEDVELSDQIRLLPKWGHIKSPIKVSARRYYPNRIWHRIFINVVIMTMYRLGFSNRKTLRSIYLFSPSTS